MNPNKTGDLDSQGIGKLLLRLALPTITAQLVNALYNMVDRIYIGHIPVVGKTALTGVGVCLSLIMIISAFAALTAMGARLALPFCWAKDSGILQNGFWATASPAPSWWAWC